MASQFLEESRRDSLVQQARYEWTSVRIQNVHRHVTALDVLGKGGVSLSRRGETEQFSCPFHGKDNKPSARYYPGTDSKPSHVWCYVCKERWDAIALWRKFNPHIESLSRALFEIEKAFALTPPDPPKELSLGTVEVKNPALEEFAELIAIAERRLVNSKVAYKVLGDLRGYLSAGVVLDRIRYRVESGVLSPSQGSELIRQVLDKITKKVRACPVG